MTADLTDPHLRDRAVRAARGQEPFDLVLTGGHVVDVALGEVRRADIGITGALIASVHEAGEARARERLDIRGGFVAPGLIDSHMHVESSMVTPRRYAEVVVPQGTTTICWDPHELANVKGLDGVAWAIEASRGLPLEVLVLAPSCVPSAPGLERAGAMIDAAAMARMLAWPEVVGVAEVMDMRGVLERQPHMAGVVRAGLASGKPVFGHARGLEGPDLQAFRAAGILTDHEIVGADDLLAKLRAGFDIELRGSHDYLLPDCVAALEGLARFPQTLSLCSDDVFPDTLVAKGAMVDLVRRLVAYGLDPLSALQAATLNAARRLGRLDLGRVAPGHRADLAVFGDLRSFEVRAVLKDGVPVARDGRLEVPLPEEPGDRLDRTVHVPPLDAEAFEIRAEGRAVRLRTIVGARFTRWGEVEAAVRDGRVRAPDGTLRMAVVHRHGHAAPTPQLALLEDWGTWRGALATTVSHDSHNLTVFGSDTGAMARAANAVVDAGGGMAVADTSDARAVLALPVAGLVADAPARTVAAAFEALVAAADTVADWQPPYRTFKATTGASLACNPCPHLTDKGLTDGADGTVWPSPGLQAERSTATPKTGAVSRAARKP